MKNKVLNNSMICGVCFVMLATSACSKQEEPNTIDLSSGAYNPIYMGASMDLYGNEAVVGKGAGGQIANQALLDYYAKYAKPEVHKLTDKVYVANGYGTANTIMIEGDDGLVIVNTNDTVEIAKKELEAFKQISDKPITDIIYTNYQHSYGAQAYMPETAEQSVQIIAHESHKSMIDQLISEETQILNARKAVVNGELLANEGEDGSLGAGLGVNKTKGTMGYVAPTKLLSGKEVTKLNVNGINMEFIPAQSDSKDNFIIWLPDESVCINDFALETFPSYYNLAGDSCRNTKLWLDGLNEIIELNPKYLLGTYGLPLTEEDNIKDELVLYRDALQYVYNQTVRYMNKNYSLDKILSSVKLPDKLLSGKLTGEFFGEADYHIRGIYNDLIGWFGNDTIELHSVTDKFEAKKIIEGYGGTDKVIEEGKKAVDEKRYSWAVQLASYILENEPENEAAINIKVDALRSMAQITTSSDTRNYYLTEVARLEGKIANMMPMEISKDKLLLSSRDSYLKILKVSLDPEKCGDSKFGVNFNFTDENVKYGFNIRNGIAIITENPEATDVEIKLSYDVFCDIAAGAKKLDDCIASGEVLVEGDAEKFQKFRSIFDIVL